MDKPKASLLIVDDDELVRTSMSQVFVQIGYRVRSASDGFSALAEIRNEIPDTILSDLNMPGMSGFEFLAVVRRRFPSIQVIAMSGAFSGEEVPSGVAADAFYQKGSGMGAILKIVGGLGKPERALVYYPPASARFWIQKNAQSDFGDSFVTIDCPECLRTFTEPVDDSGQQIREVDCVHCGNPMYYSIVEPADWALAPVFLKHGSEAKSPGQEQLN